MTRKERAQELVAKATDLYWYVGIRYDNRDLPDDYAIEPSKHNHGREDEREFPNYGSDEYNAMPWLDGTCAWDINHSWCGISSLDTIRPNTDHCYIIASDSLGDSDYCPDDYELLLHDAVVVGKIF